MQGSTQQQWRPEIASKMAFLYLSYVAIAILGYVALFFAVRFVGQVPFGIVAFSLSFSGVLFFLTDLGFHRAHIKRVSEEQDIQACVSTYLLVRLILTGLFALGTLLLIFIWEAILDIGYESPESRDVIFIIMAYYIPFSLNQVFMGTFLAKRDVVKAQTISLSDVLTRVIATIIVVVLGFGVIGLASTYLIAGSVSLLVSITLSRRTIPSLSLRYVRKDLLRDYAKFAAPLAIATILGTIILYFDKVIIQLSASAVETSLYYASQRLLAPYLSLAPAVILLIFPIISFLDSREGRSDDIRVIVRGTLKYIGLIIIPFTFFICVFSADILSIFLSSAFGDASTAFAILSVAYGLAALTSPLTSQMLGMGYSGRYAKYNIISAVVVICLDVILIPEELLSIRLLGLGINGAALALLSGKIVSMLLFYSNSIRTVGITLPAEIPRIFLAALLSTLTTYVLSSYIIIERFYHISFLFILFVSVYLALTVIMKIMTPRQLIELLRLFTLRGLLSR